jgi:hypothetical protein
VIRMPVANVENDLPAELDRLASAMLQSG